MGSGKDRIGIIGVGNLGSACVRAWLTKGLIAAEDLVLVERDATRCAALSSAHACAVSSDPASVRDCTIIFLAIKPQDLGAAVAPLRGHLATGSTVVSLLAGMPLARLTDYFGPNRGYVRAMPNINATVFAGMTVWCAGAAATPTHCGVVERLLGGIGAVLRVENEALIDAATAVSASGPGYVFYIIEHMIQASERLGFTPDQAHQLVAETLAGSVAMWRASPLTPVELRALVTSKGGTTAAAIEVFERGSLGQILEAGMIRADERCRELARSV